MICSVCVTNSPDVLGIFDDMGVQLNIANVIEKHLWFKPKFNGSNSPNICKKCWNIVNDFHDFYNQTEQAYNAFHTETLIIKEEDEPLLPLPIKEEMEDVQHEEKTMQLEMEIETKNHESCCSNDTQRNPLDNDCPSEDSAVSSRQYVNDCEVTFNSATDTSCSSFSSDDEKLTDLIQDSDKKRKGVIKKHPKAITMKKKKIESKSEEDDVLKRKRKRLDPKLTEEMIQKHISMVCNLCNVDCQTFANVAIHFEEQHAKMKPYIMCCNKRFTRRHYIAQHALQHEDPNCFRCNECNKSFKTTYNLHTHNLSFHNKEENGIHACELCPQKFARRKLLEFHKPVHIPKEKWSFLCAKCPTPRPFASQYLLNAHESVHKRETNICHVCAKEIKDKYLFEKHVRLHFEDSGPRVKCPYPDCESWLKDEYNLKDHLRRHNIEGIIYKCPQCGKECRNRKALSQHKRNNHSDKVYKCGQCDKSFKKAITLKEHMAYHTGESLYTCPFCPRTFNSNANMYSHKKKQHPVSS